MTSHCSREPGLSTLPTSPTSPSALPSSTAAQATEAGTVTTALANGLPMSAEIAGLIKAIHIHGTENTVQARLQGLPMAEKALIVVDILNFHREQSEILGINLEHVWSTYVVPEKLWEYYEGGEAKFKQDIAFTEFIAPTLKKAEESKIQKGRSIALLATKWGAGWEKTIEPNSTDPSLLSEHYLKNTAFLARNGMMLSNAMHLVNHAKETRISHPGKGVRKTPVVIPGDILKVVDAMKMVSKSNKIKPEECAIADLLAFLDRESVNKRITELETPEATQNSSPLTALPSPDARHIPIQVSATTAPQDVCEMEGPFAPDGTTTGSSASCGAIQVGMQIEVAGQQVLLPTSHSSDEGVMALDPVVTAMEEFSTLNSVLEVNSGSPSSALGLPVSGTLPSPSPTPLPSPPNQTTPPPEQHVNDHQAITPVSQDRTTSQSIQFSSPSGSGPQSPRPGPALSGFPESVPEGDPSLQEAPLRILTPAFHASAPTSPLQGTPHLSPGRIPVQSSQRAMTEPSSPPCIPLLPTMRSSLLPSAAHDSPPGPSLSAVSDVIASSPPAGTVAAQFSVGSCYSIGEQSVRQVTPAPNRPRSLTPTALCFSLPTPCPTDSSSQLAAPIIETEQSSAFSCRPPAPLLATNPTTEPARPQSNQVAAGSLPQQTSRKRRHSQTMPGYTEFLPPSPFKLQKNWSSNNPVRKAISGQGFYIGTDASQFGDARCPKAFLDELDLYRRLSACSGGVRLDNCFHSLLQQGLVQHPLVYLAALAAMKTQNHRMVSLPVAPLIFRNTKDSKLMDSDFPFDKFIARERRVPAARLLYSLRDANIHIAPKSCGKAAVKEWWDNCDRNLEVAATKLPLAEFSTAELKAGEFITFPPQLPWYPESILPVNSSVPCLPGVILEVRYVAVNSEKRLDFDYWPEGSYDKISRLNRDLLGPTVTGWGKGALFPCHEGRFMAAIEMRGIWAIGDALLGLMSWESPLVKLELEKLFDAPPGEWFNREFVQQVQTLFDQKLVTVAESSQLLQKSMFVLG